MAFRYTAAPSRGLAWSLSTFAGNVFKGMCLVYTVQEYGVWITSAAGPSMLPTIESGDILLSNQVSNFVWR
jgi:signal peptidase I